MEETELVKDLVLEEDDKDDLEFHMTFPSPGQAPGLDESSKSPESFVMLNPEPVVFLLGWGGCDDKHLAKYSQLYEDLGCITIRYTAPAEYILLRPEKTAPLGKKLLDLIEEMSLHDNPIFIHIFSNNGANLYRNMLQVIKTEKEYQELEKQIRGLVFDSSPGRRRLRSLMRASYQIYGRGSSPNTLLRYLAPIGVVILALFWHVIRLVLGVTSGQRRASDGDQFVGDWYDYLLHRDNLSCPTMFLYSSSDDLVMPEDIEEVATMREKKGCDVTRIRFDESPHVQHLKVHREVYINSIRSFLKKCLQKKRDE